MTNDKQSLTDYYDEKGKVRFMMVTSKEHKAELTRRCKSLGISQGAMLEVLLDLYDGLDPQAIKDAAAKQQVSKRSGRVSTSAVSKKLKGLPKEQLAAIEKFIEEQLLQAKKDADNCAEHGVFS
ncbi:MAG: hypothetical protein Q7T57_05990, partial [Dehalococcoidales bacterium]|nr:hypothetical protein [Dehalococcoidales bacterium]